MPRSHSVRLAYRVLLLLASGLVVGPAWAQEPPAN
jgi:hypothetical protein